MTIIGSINVPDDVFEELKNTHLTGLINEHFQTNLDEIVDLDERYGAVEDKVVALIQDQSPKNYENYEAVLLSEEFKAISKAASTAARQTIDITLARLATQVNLALNRDDATVKLGRTHP